MPGRTLRTAVSTLLAGVFLLSLGTETFGWHDCPHHHRGTRTGTAAAGAVPAESSVQIRAAADADGRTGSVPAEHESGPCTCVGNCHGAAASPLPAVLPAVPSVAEGTVRVALRPDARGLPLRHASYFLPYPNGPPPA